MMRLFWSSSDKIEEEKEKKMKNIVEFLETAQELLSGEAFEN